MARDKKHHHMIVSTDAVKAFDKIHRPFFIKTLTVLGMEGNMI